MAAFLSVGGEARRGGISFKVFRFELGLLGFRGLRWEGDTPTKRFAAGVRGCRARRLAPIVDHTPESHAVNLPFFLFITREPRVE